MWIYWENLRLEFVNKCIDIWRRYFGNEWDIIILDNNNLFEYFEFSDLFNGMNKLDNIV